MLCIVARFTRFTMKECSQGSNILSTLLEFWFVSVRQFDTYIHVSTQVSPAPQPKETSARTRSQASTVLLYCGVRVCVMCHVPRTKFGAYLLYNTYDALSPTSHITISFHRVTPSFSSFFWPSPIVRPYLYQFLPMLHVPL